MKQTIKMKVRPNTQVQDTVTIRTKGKTYLAKKTNLTAKQRDELENLLFKSAFEVTSKANETDNLASLYFSRLRHIVYNLSDANSPLKTRISEGYLSIKNLLDIRPQQMNPDLWRDYNQQEEAEVGEIANGRLVSTTTLYTCGRCKAKNCSYRQEQTRSADEGVTNFITCNNCGKQWKEHN